MEACEQTFNHAAYFALCPEMCHCLCGPLETHTFHCCNIDAAPECPPYPPLPTPPPPPTTSTTTPAPLDNCDENCFPSSAKVLLENGKSVSMSKLQVGDKKQVQTGMQ